MANFKNSFIVFVAYFFIFIEKIVNFFEYINEKIEDLKNKNKLEFLSKVKELKKQKIILFPKKTDDHTIMYLQSRGISIEDVLQFSCLDKVGKYKEFNLFKNNCNINRQNNKNETCFEVTANLVYQNNIREISKIQLCINNDSEYYRIIELKSKILNYSPINEVEIKKNRKYAKKFFTLCVV